MSCNWVGRKKQFHSREFALLASPTDWERTSDVITARKTERHSRLFLVALSEWGVTQWSSTPVHRLLASISRPLYWGRFITWFLTKVCQESGSHQSKVFVGHWEDSSSVCEGHPTAPSVLSRAVSHFTCSYMYCSCNWEYQQYWFFMLHFFENVKMLSARKA